MNRGTSRAMSVIAGYSGPSTFFITLLQENAEEK
jgi:hypothetical protein